jgi:acyl-CoA thioesterase FadM
LCVEIVDSDARILHALHMDDLVDVEATSSTTTEDNELHYNVKLYVTRGQDRLKAVVANVVVLLKIDDSPVTNGGCSSTLAELMPYAVERISRPESRDSITKTSFETERGLTNPDDAAVRELLRAEGNTFVWKWHIPYFYCHFTERMQHSGYLRLMEEVEDLFLADRGISIRTMLHSKKLIPVVPHVRVEILEEAYMEEPVYTVYTLEEMYKEYTYTHCMDCYILREGRLIKTATGKITHGYAVIDNRRDWSLVAMDEDTIEAINNEKG